MGIGNFSVSLAVKDIKVSKAFYDNLGFIVFQGDMDQNWLIMKNDDCTIGLFQGMFNKNILTFNPGWDINAKEIPSFKDVRIFQGELREKGIQLLSEVDLSTKGPASFTFEDPDGNLILIDQHV